MTLGPAYGDGGGGAGGGLTALDYIKVSESTTNTQLGSGTGAGTEITVNFDTEDENTDATNFSLASEVITVAEAGEYRIEFMISYIAGSAGKRQLRTNIEIDPNTTTFADAPDTFAWQHGESDERWSGYGETQQTLVANSIIRLRGQRNIGTMTTNVDRLYTSMTVTKIG